MIETLFFLYLLFFGVFLIYLNAMAILFPRKKSRPGVEMTLSVVIPCRNEAENLNALAASLERQKCEKHFDLIFIDDSSTDKTMESLKKIQDGSFLPITILQGKYDPDRHLTSKQQAIDLGIRESGNSHIVLTDADMLFETNWLRSLVDSLHPDTDLVFGHTSILPGPGVFETFQAFQLEFLFSAAAVFHYTGIAGSCMGNNLLIRKKAYIECGGFDAIGYSLAEDRALLHHFHRTGRKIAITTPFVPTAVTFPHRSVGALISQLKRWSLGGFTTGFNLPLIGLCLGIQNIFTVLATAGFLSMPVSVVVWSNIALIWLLVVILFRKNHSKISSLLFPVYYPLFIIESLLLPVFFLPVRTVRWKGRVVG